MPGPGVNKVGKAQLMALFLEGETDTNKIGKHPHYRLLCVLGRNHVVSWERGKKAEAPWLAQQMDREDLSEAM